MSATYEPGTVVKATVRGVPDVLLIKMEGGTDWWVAPLGGRSVTEDADATDVRPLAVIDPQDGDQVARIARLYKDCGAPTIEEAFARILAAYATPAPSLLDEPQEWGARVTDAKGFRWLRTEPDAADDLAWVSENNEGWAKWKHIPQPARLGWDEVTA